MPAVKIPLTLSSLFRHKIMKYFKIIILFILILFIFISCSAENWYQGMQQAAVKECDKYPYQSVEYEKCIEKADISYEQYKRDLNPD